MTGHVRRCLDVLCAYYSDREGNPRRLNTVQATVYADGLAPFDDVALEFAARQWMRQSKYFPALSELLELLTPTVDLDTLAQTAWARLERELRRIGQYRAVRFEDPAFGLAVRETFGSWAAACQFDIDSPGWAIRRQTFLAVFKAAVTRCVDGDPVVLAGLHPGAPVSIEHLEGLPAAKTLGSGADRSKEVLAEVTRRAMHKAAERA